MDVRARARGIFLCAMKKKNNKNDCNAPFETARGTSCTFEIHIFRDLWNHKEQVFTRPIIGASAYESPPER